MKIINETNIWRFPSRAISNLSLQQLFALKKKTQSGFFKSHGPEIKVLLAHVKKRKP